MTGWNDPDPVEREQLTEQDLAIATLVGRYIERRKRDERRHACTTCSPSPRSSATAPEFGDCAVDVLRTVLACYEAMRASEDGAR